jgi:hypothetical protein
VESSTRDFEDRRGSRDVASHSEEAERGHQGRPPLLATLEYVKKGFGYGNLQRGFFPAEENLECGGRFIFLGL